MTCPECGSPITVVDGVVQYHTTLDTLTPCNGPKGEAKTEEAEAKPAPRKRTKKAEQ